MARPIIDTLTESDRRKLAEATTAVEEARRLLSDATAVRHQLWRDYVSGGAGQGEVARASGVIRQAVGWAIDHPPAEVPVSG